MLTWDEIFLVVCVIAIFVIMVGGAIAKQLRERKDGRQHGRDR